MTEQSNDSSDQKQERKQGENKPHSEPQYEIPSHIVEQLLT